MVPGSPAVYSETLWFSNLGSFMFHNLSIRFKLVVLLGTAAAIALLISSVLTLYSTFNTQRNESLRGLKQLANVSSENLRAALAFRDDSSAARILSPLQTNPHILAAFIEDEEGRPFSCYFASDVPEHQADQIRRNVSVNLGAVGQRQAAQEQMTFEYSYVATPIEFEGKRIGSLAIVSDNKELHRKLIDYIRSQLLISVATLVVLLLISIPLEQLFTRPIFTLIDTMKEISKTKDYTVSVVLNRSDEFNDLCLGFNTMLGEIRERDEKLSRLATTDALTGLANRRHAMESMATMLTRSRRKAEPLGVIILDVDFFKKINDTFGHPVGDIVLKAIARILVQSAREYDLVARIGGEEFLVLCDNADQETVRLVAERIRTSIEQTPVEYGAGEQLRVTVSLGAFAAVPVDLDEETLLKIVDDALYRAKQAGRNQVQMGDRG
jgi:diguanylate cyclase (GGDEF)-like protein